MAYDVSQRQPTAEEAAFIKTRFGVGVGSWIDTVLIPLIPGGGVCFIVMVIVGLAFRLFRENGLTPNDIIWMLVISFGAGGAMWLRVFVDFRRQRRRQRVDIAQRVVEVIRVTDPRLVQQEEHNDEGPLYYFGIGHGERL